MTTTSHMQTRAYSVLVEFQSDSDVYASERYAILAVDEYDAERLARMKAEDSVYHHARIPDLTLAVTVEECEPPRPDPMPPAAAALRPVCPKCGSGDLAKDAWAQWDTVSQAWTLFSTYDHEACQLCEMEGENLAIWVPVDADGFLWALADRLQCKDLVLDSDFQLFCLNVAGELTVDQARDEWRLRSGTTR